jgi:hypothetical protein
LSARDISSHLTGQNTHSEGESIEMIHQINGIPKQAGVVIPISVKVAIKPKLFKEN